MSYLVLQRHANEQIVLTANPDVSDEDLIRHIRDQGIAVCVTRTGEKTVNLGISAPESILILRAELLKPYVL
ncbi:carbon storage regulator [Pseudomonas aeruginosa]|uniref:carbon storage regulator n=1 Tax=Pseudomonas aeruginosa TaxID=287 RepID=UPI003A4D4461